MPPLKDLDWKFSQSKFQCIQGAEEQEGMSQTLDTHCTLLYIPLGWLQRIGWHTCHIAGRWPHYGMCTDQWSHHRSDQLIQLHSSHMASSGHRQDDSGIPTKNSESLIIIPKCGKVSDGYLTKWIIQNLFKMGFILKASSPNVSSNSDPTFITQPDLYTASESDLYINIWSSGKWGAIKKPYLAIALSSWLVAVGVKAVQSGAFARSTNGTAPPSGRAGLPHCPHAVVTSKSLSTVAWISKRTGWVFLTLGSVITRVEMVTDALAFRSSKT